jgi:hypothetical protein
MRERRRLNETDCGLGARSECYWTYSSRLFVIRRFRRLIIG